MAYIIADNILSPLGETTEQNYNAVLNGNSALAHYSHKWNLPISFCASLFTEEQNKRINKEELTHFESMVLFSIKQAIAQTQIDISSPRVVLVISTTKGNVEILSDNKHDIQTELPGKSAQKIASILGMTSSPIVVCNACISGVSAIIIASRLI
jgi:3-oxoacyl-[acyl-carrier-protein] synthase-1